MSDNTVVNKVVKANEDVKITGGTVKETTVKKDETTQNSSSNNNITSNTSGTSSGSGGNSSSRDRDERDYSNIVVNGSTTIGATTYGNIYRKTILNGDVTVNVISGQNAKISNVEVNGDVIVNGGGDLTLEKTKITGKLIVNDVAEHTLNILDSNIENVVVNDTNGGRVIVQGSNIDEFKTEIGSNLNLELKDGAYVNDLYVKSNNLLVTESAVNKDITGIINFIERGPLTTLSEIGVGNTTLDEIRKQVNTADEIKNKIEEINRIYVSSSGITEAALYNELGLRTALLLDDAVEKGIISSSNYSNYDLFFKFSIATTILALRRDQFWGSFTSQDELQRAFNYAVDSLYLTKETRKIKGWLGNSSFNQILGNGEGTEYAIIRGGINAGEEMTNLVLNYTTPLATDISATLLSAINNEDEYIQIFNHKAYLMKQNILSDEGVPIEVELFVAKKDNQGNFLESTNTNLFTKIEKTTTEAVGYVKKSEIKINKGEDIKFTIFTQNSTSASIGIYGLSENDINITPSAITTTESAIENVENMEGLIEYSITTTSLQYGKNYALKVIVRDDNGRESQYEKRFKFEYPLDLRLSMGDITTVNIDASNVVYYEYNLREHKKFNAKILDDNNNEYNLSDGKILSTYSVRKAGASDTIVNKIFVSSTIKDGKLETIEVGIANPTAGDEGDYFVNLKIKDKYFQPVADLGTITVNFKDENSIKSFVDIFKNFTEATRLDYSALDYEKRASIRNAFISSNDKSEEKFKELLEQYKPFSLNLEEIHGTSSLEISFRLNGLNSGIYKYWVGDQKINVTSETSFDGWTMYTTGSSITGVKTGQFIVVAKFDNTGELVDWHGSRIPFIWANSTDFVENKIINIKALTPLKDDVVFGLLINDSSINEFSYYLNDITSISGIVLSPNLTTTNLSTTFSNGQFLNILLAEKDTDGKYLVYDVIENYLLLVAEKNC